jgi:hypothetical protein
MFSKSMSDRSAPHHGIGRRSKCFSAFSRNLRIQSGSDFSAEISSTTAGDSPRFGSKTEWSASFQSKRYPFESSWRCSSCVTAMTCSPKIGRAPGLAIQDTYPLGAKSIAAVGNGAPAGI